MEEFMEDRSFRNKAAFGKRIEYYIIGLMLKEGLDVYQPIVDDDAIDVVVKKADDKFVMVQIKATSDKNKEPTLFAAITHSYRKNYWFVFYSDSDKHKCIWILSSKEFVKEASENKKGKNKGKYSINFTKKLNKYKVNNFERIKKEDPDEI